MIPPDHVETFRYMIAERMLADEELIDEALATWPSASLSNVVGRLDFYAKLADQMAPAA